MFLMSLVATGPAAASEPELPNATSDSHKTTAEEAVAALGVLDEVHAVIDQILVRLPGSQVRLVLITDPDTGCEKPWVEIVPESLGEAEWKAYDLIEDEIWASASPTIRAEIGLDIT